MKRFLLLTTLALALPSCSNAPCLDDGLSMEPCLIPFNPSTDETCDDESSEGFEDGSLDVSGTGNSEGDSGTPDHSHDDGGDEHSHDDDCGCPDSDDSDSTGGESESSETSTTDSGEESTESETEEETTGEESETETTESGEDTDTEGDDSGDTDHGCVCDVEEGGRCLLRPRPGQCEFRCEWGLKCKKNKHPKKTSKTSHDFTPPRHPWGTCQ